METIRPETIQEPLVTQSSVQTTTSTVKGEEKEAHYRLGAKRENCATEQAIRYNHGCG